MPIYNLIPYGGIYFYKVNAESEDEAIEKFISILKESNVSEEDMEHYLTELIIENTNL